LRGSNAVFVTRRTLFAAAAAPLLPAAGAWQSALSTRAASLGGPGLLRSFDVQEGAGAFDRAHATCAYVYDNALAGLALLATGDRAGAMRIAAALAYAQAHDRAWHDGRLRNAYRAGPAPSTGDTKLNGWWDDAAGKWFEDGYQAGTATGVLAWAMLLWIALGHEYRSAAERAADFVETHLRGPQGFVGGFQGFEPSPQRLAWVSTEQNLDLAVAFSALGRTGAARHARAFVAAMWRADQQRFNMGLRPDGSVNDGSALDANLWPLLATGTLAWVPVIDWVLARHGLPVGPPSLVDGVDFNTDRDGLWLEGTAITALACKRYGRPSSRLMATLRANTAAGGLIYATSSPTLTTGLSTGVNPDKPDFLYYRRPHIAPTSWAVFAASGTTPFPGTDD